MRPDEIHEQQNATIDGQFARDHDHDRDWEQIVERLADQNVMIAELTGVIIKQVELIGVRMCAQAIEIAAAEVLRPSEPDEPDAIAE